MKNIFLVTFLFIANTSFAQKEIAFTISESRVAHNNSGDYLHKIANVFANSVGDALKANSPAKVSSVHISIKKGKGGYEVSYTALIVRGTEDDYHYYFDHRGSMSSHEYKLNAVTDARNRAEGQLFPAMVSFKDTYSWSGMLEFVQESHTDKEQTLAIAEYFFVGR